MQEDMQIERTVCLINQVIAGNQERNKKRIVEMIVNNAIEKAEKKSMRKLFQSKYDKRGCLILRDKDFEVG